MSGLVAEALRDTLQRALQPYSYQRLIIALSGGVDSTALLNLCVEHLGKEQILALHINHHLQPEADLWVEHCAELCNRLGVDFQVIDVFPIQASEDAARQSRYSAFEQFLAPGDLLLMGHQADDQAETLLFRMFRGTGVRGMGGMPVSRPLGKGRLLRPLLTCTRQDLEIYLLDRGLNPILDPSNSDCRYSRSLIRSELSPRISARWPGWQVRTARLARQLDQAQHLLAELAAIDLAEQSQASILNLRPLLKLSQSRLSNALYLWLERQGVKVNHQDQFNELIERCRDDSVSFSSILAGVRLHIYQSRLYVEHEELRVADQQEIALTPGALRFASGVLELESGVGLPVGLDCTLRSRCLGERVRIPERGRVKLKKLMNELSIPPWLRDVWPLLEYKGEVVCIVNYWIRSDLKVDSGICPKWRF